MSFGISVGDFIMVGQLALQVYRGCKGAAGQFEEVIREVSAVSIVVKDLEDHAACADSLLNRQGSHKSSELKSVVDNIRVALEELGDLARRYASLNSIQKRKWDTIRFATKDITDIRARLAFHVQAAQTILDSLQRNSLAHIELQNDNSLNALERLEAESTNNRQALARIEQLLADKIQEVKQGSREPSMMSGDGWNIWSELRRDLQFEGLSPDVLRLYKVEIKTYLVSLMDGARLQGDLPVDGDDDPAMQVSRQLTAHDNSDSIIHIESGLSDRTTATPGIDPSSDGETQGAGTGCTFDAAADILPQVDGLLPLANDPTDAITASQSLKPYARSLSHELRTPMQGVVGMLDVMHATVQEAIEGQANSKVRNVFQALKENIEVVQDSSRRAVEAADNVVHAYSLDMQIPGTPQHESESPAVSMSSTSVFENRRGILIEGSNIPVNPYKRRRSSPVGWNYGNSTKVRNVRASPPREGLPPRSEELKSVVQESEVMLRSTSEIQVEGSHLSPDEQQNGRRSSLGGSIDVDASPTPGLRQSRIRELIPLVIHESLRVGGRPDSAIAEPTALGEKIEVRTRSSSGHASQINIEWSVHPDVPESLLMDERDLAKLISCVFLNAIKFTENGNITLTAQPARNGRFVLVNIVDTGMGIPEDFLPELFKLFSREDASLTRTKEGLGLGLLVAKSIARRVGGDLTLIRSNTSGDHKGSEFEIKVPINVGEVSRSSTPSNRTPTPSGGASYRSGLDKISRPTSHHSKTSHSKSRGSPLQPTSPSRHNSNPVATPSMFEDPPFSSPRRMSSSSSSTSKIAKPQPPNKDTFDRKLAEKQRPGINWTWVIWKPWSYTKAAVPLSGLKLEVWALSSKAAEVLPKHVWICSDGGAQHARFE